MNTLIKRLTHIEQVNFLLTNRIPRRYATLFMGWFSKIENPLVTWLSLTLWRLFSDELDLREAKKTHFKSLHDCFTRELKDGVRPFNKNPDVICSPCDAIVGAFGNIRGTELIQAKGFPYNLMDLLNDRTLVERYRDGTFITLRLKSTMYHRFHAPCQVNVSDVNYISGDTWNVNPVTLKRIERLYCRNERAVIDMQLADERGFLTMVPVAAILVAGIRLHCLNETLDLRYRGSNRLSCNRAYKKGDEMGYFQHGSTIILFAERDVEVLAEIEQGKTVRAGEALLRFTKRMKKL